MGSIPGLNWNFQNEPLYKWFIFFVAMTCFAAAWGMVLHHMRAAV